MNNKLLLILSLLIAIGAGWFFGNNTKVEPPIKVAPPEVEYEATEINAVQTNDEGETEYEVNAKSLSHNNKTNKDELLDVTMDWQPTEGKKYQLTSGVTDLDQQTGELRMSGGFKLVSHAEGKDGKAVEPIIIVGDRLQGNTKLKQVRTDHPIKFKQGDNQFTAKGLVANLETGEYQFTGIEISFTPAERQDKPLF